MIFYLIRHGDPIYNPDSLTPLGRRQAEAVAKRLTRVDFDEIYVSSSQRAKDTAVPTCEILKKEPIELDWCNEGHAARDFFVDDEDEGRRLWFFQSVKFKKIALQDNVRMLGEKWYEAPEFEGTNFKNGMLRINKETDAFFETLGYEHLRDKHCFVQKENNDKRIALFAHQGFGLALLSSILDLSYIDISVHYDLSHSSVTAIEFKETGGIVIPKILTLSNDSHLFSEGLPTKFNGVII